MLLKLRPVFIWFAQYAKSTTRLWKFLQKNLYYLFIFIRHTPTYTRARNTYCIKPLMPYCKIFWLSFAVYQYLIFWIITRPELAVDIYWRGTYIVRPSPDLLSPEEEQITHMTDTTNVYPVNDYKSKVELYIIVIVYRQTTLTCFSPCSAAVWALFRPCSAPYILSLRRQFRWTGIQWRSSSSWMRNTDLIARFSRLVKMTSNVRPSSLSTWQKFNRKQRPDVSHWNSNKHTLVCKYNICLTV